MALQKKKLFLLFILEFLLSFLPLHIEYFPIEKALQQQQQNFNLIRQIGRMVFIQMQL